MAFLETKEQGPGHISRWRRCCGVRWSGSRYVSSDGSQEERYPEARLTVAGLRMRLVVVEEERPRPQLRLGEGEEGRPSRTRVSLFYPSATTRMMDGSRGSLKTTRPWGFLVPSKALLPRGSLGMTIGLRHTRTATSGGGGGASGAPDAAAGGGGGVAVSLAACLCTRAPKPRRVGPASPGPVRARARTRLRPRILAVGWDIGCATALELENNEGGTSDPEVVEPAQRQLKRERKERMRNKT